ncbi:translin-like [Mya arenaria]|uniref:translin-like n=1 Tax=Mya arenaria TaxID=6604 RepID=UPI0022E8F122|nr:translin-like [Mya arenaria]
MGEKSNITSIFANFQQYLTDEQDLREEIRVIVRELEQSAREILTHIQTVHQPEGIKDVSTVCEQTVSMFEQIRQGMTNLAVKIPENQYYRYNDQWRFVMQRLAFLSAYLTYLQDESMISIQQVAQIIGVKVVRTEGFHIDLEDYLMGLLQLASELSRLAVNSVTAGDYGRPIRIAKFVGEMDSGFRLLNLKNDSLRKRFDGLKYDLKKVEEVVYDLTIRGLKPAD